MEDELSATWTQVLEAKGIQKMMTIGITKARMYNISRGKYRQTNV